MEEARRRSLGSQAQHTHSLEDHTWSIQQSTTTHTKHIHNIQQQNSNYTQTHCELFHQTIHKHATHTKQTDTLTEQHTTSQQKLLQTNIPGTIIKFIANYIKGCKAYTTYINHTFKQRQFKTGVPQGDVLSPTLFNICTSDLPPPSAPVQVMAYADDITITSTHTRTTAAKKYIQPYLHKVFSWTKQNNL